MPKYKLALALAFLTIVFKTLQVQTGKFSNLCLTSVLILEFIGDIDKLSNFV